MHCFLEKNKNNPWQRLMIKSRYGKPPKNMSYWFLIWFLVPVTKNKYGIIRWQDYAQAAFISTIVGAGAAFFGLYVGKAGSPLPKGRKK